LKRIRCTKCGQVFWTELQVEEALVGNGEWIQSPCPRCGAEWAVAEPLTKRTRATRKRMAKPASKLRARRQKTGRPAEGAAPSFSPGRIRRLRKKLGISQKELAALTGVSSGAIVSWEKGKFKPKRDKISQLTDFAKLGRDGVRKLLAEKKAKQAEEKKPQEARVKKPEGDRKRRMKKKAVPASEELKSQH